MAAVPNTCIYTNADNGMQGENFSSLSSEMINDDVEAQKNKAKSFEELNRYPFLVRLVSSLLYLSLTMKKYYILFISILSMNRDF
jgi:hypothetical protein